MFYEFKLITSIMQTAGVIICAVLMLVCLKKVGAKINTSNEKIIRFLKLGEGIVNDLGGKASIGNWILTVFAYLIYFAMCQTILVSLGISMSFIDVCFVISTMSLILLIPVSIAGFGPREATLILLLARYGVSAESALSFSLLQFTVFFLFGGLLGLVAMLSAPLPLWRIREES
jgi:uncharacterized membrane protein YbhN (UPF0104 family)